MIGNSPNGTYEMERKRAMAAYDRLPRYARRLVLEADNSYAAPPVATFLRKCRGAKPAQLHLAIVSNDIIQAEECWGAGSIQHAYAVQRLDALTAKYAAGDEA